MHLQLPLGYRLPAAAGGVNPAARDGRRGLRLHGPEHPDIQGRRLLLHLPVWGDGGHSSGPEVLQGPGRPGDRGHKHRGLDHQPGVPLRSPHQRGP